MSKIKIFFDLIDCNDFFMFDLKKKNSSPEPLLKSDRNVSNL